MVGIYRVFHPKFRQYTFFSSAYGTFSKIDHVLEHKVSLNKFKKTEITPCIMSDHNGTNPQQQKKPQKIFKYMEAKQHTAKRLVGD
jgi:hypothetical protein